MKNVMEFLLAIVEPTYGFSKDEWILKYKVRILISLSFVIGLILSSFTIYRLAVGHYQLALVDGLFGSYLMISSYYLRRNKYNYDLVSKLFLILGLAVGVLNLHMAEETFTRVLWFASYILLVFFLRDKKEGFVWMGMLLALFTLIAYFEKHLGIDLLNYTTFVVNMLLIGIILYWYEKLKEGDSERLQILNESLQLKIDKAVQENQRQERLMIEQAKMAAMGEMIESIAHQWRQPLNILALSIAKVEMDNNMGVRNSEKLEKTYEEMSRQINYMSQTIDDFRSFYKKDKEQQNVSLTLMFNEVRGLISTLLQAKGIVLEQQIDEEIMVNVYVSEFKQVLLNLITNAKDALLEREITMPVIELWAYKEGDEAVIEVHDNAGGVDEAIMLKIFEPYFTTKFSSTGTGIGLYMSKLIIEDHMRGHLSVYNDELGAVFRICLPLEDNQV